MVKSGSDFKRNVINLMLKYVRYLFRIENWIAQAPPTLVVDCECRYFISGFIVHCCPNFSLNFLKRQFLKGGGLLSRNMFISVNGAFVFQHITKYNNENSPPEINEKNERPLLTRLVSRWRKDSMSIRMKLLVYS